MANERITEGIVRDHFKADALFKSIKWEEQKSGNKTISELLKGQSKGDGKGNGYPEFIISFPTNSNYLIVIECKASTAKHKSQKLDNAKDYAVDGVLHYAKALKRDFNVMAIAVSGEENDDMMVSHYYWKKESKDYKEINDKKLLRIEDYLQLFDDQFFISDFYTRDIALKARELNEEFHLRSITEDKRCTMVSGMLLSLIDNKFNSNYESQPTIKELGQSMLSAIGSVFDAEEDMVRNKSALIAEFATLLNEPLFAHDTINNTTTHKTEDTLSVAKYYISYLQKYVFPLVKHSNIGYDVLGRFYIEFIRYAQSQQKQGLVLTPPHITELFCDLAEIRLSDIIYDPCCGTGGFLVSAMQRLFRIAGNDKSQRRKIKQHQLCGVEMRPAMYAYACSNMRFRGDGKSNLYNGDCFLHEQLIKENHKPTVAFLNPPYDVGSAGQMKFIEHALNTINPQAEGRVVAIVQMSCAIKNEKELKTIKARILQRHHLKALLSMPDELFYPIGVVTCIMVFEANKPNKGRKTWFGYFKDDGFEKRKHLGRIDVRNKYKDFKKRWLTAYKNQDEIPGLSVRKEVTANDEWCAEAYMETDYSTLCDESFIYSLRNYASFLVGSNNPSIPFSFSNAPLSSVRLRLDTTDWKWFKINDVFKCETTKHAIQQELSLGDTPFVTRSAENNGISGFINPENCTINEPNCITIGAEGVFAFYQPNGFVTGVKVYTLRNDCLNSFNAIFVCTLLNKEAYRYNYGNARILDKIKKEKIKLPIDLSGNPNWQWMENYIKGLPYSRCL